MLATLRLFSIRKTLKAEIVDMRKGLDVVESKKYIDYSKTQGVFINYSLNSLENSLQKIGDFKSLQQVYVIINNMRLELEEISTKIHDIVKGGLNFNKRLESTVKKIDRVNDLQERENELSTEYYLAYALFIVFEVAIFITDLIELSGLIVLATISIAMILFETISKKNIRMAYAEAEYLDREGVELQASHDELIRTTKDYNRRYSEFSIESDKVMNGYLSQNGLDTLLEDGKKRK